MTRAALSLVTLVLAYSILAQNTPEPDFRKATWGMSQAQVMATEPNRPTAGCQDNGEVVVKFEALDPPGG